MPDVKLRRILLAVIAAVAVIAVLSVVSDVHQVRDRLRGFGWWAFGAALGLAVGNYLFRFIRWQLLLRDRGLAVPLRVSGVVFVSGFALAVTPGKVGELVKSLLLRSIRGIPAAQTAPVVIAERVGDLVALLLLAVIGVALYGVALSLVVGAGAIVALMLLVLAWPALAHRLADLATRPRFLRRFRDKSHELVEGLAALSRPSVLLWSTALSTVAWLCECVGFALIIDAFPGADVPFGLAMLIYAATTIAGALSFVPGGLGVTEGGMTLLLVSSSHGIDQPTAAAATILTRLATLWFAVGIGVVAMGFARRLERDAILLP